MRNKDCDPSKMIKVIVNKTGKTYLIENNWRAIGSQEENQIRKENNQYYYLNHFNDYEAWGCIEKNGMPYGRLRVLYKSEVTEIYNPFI